MKFDERILNHFNEIMYAPEILEAERNERIGGSDYNISCVAHSDAMPSMRVYIEPGRHCYCFSCGKTYTPYSILKHLTGFNWTEIIEYAQQNYGYVIPADLSLYEDKPLPNNHIASCIRALRKYSSINVLDMVNYSLCIDAKEGNARRIEALRDKVYAIKEQDQI
jgi:hypothetical protein